MVYEDEILDSLSDDDEDMGAEGEEDLGGDEDEMGDDGDMSEF